MHCIVVKRGDYRQFWDRRRIERRDPDPPSRAGNRYGAERRGVTPPSWVALGFVVAEH